LEEEDGINSKINFDLSLLKGIPLSAKVFLLKLEKNIFL